MNDELGKSTEAELARTPFSCNGHVYVHEDGSGEICIHCGKEKPDEDDLDDGMGGMTEEERATLRAINETGERAFHAGIRLKDNTYPKGSDEHAAWEHGWRWASSFKKSANR